MQSFSRSAWSAEARGAVLLATLLAGCGGGHRGPLVDPDAGGSEALDAGPLEAGAEARPPCTWVIPDTCPDPKPSYAADVEPVLVARCRSCHQPGGVMQSAPLTTYQQVYARRVLMLTQLFSCKMPPPPEPPLPRQDGDRIFAWLVCGAPNN